MADRERLIELLRRGMDKHEAEIENYVVPKAEFYAEYLLANGVIVPSCKVGDFIYKPMKTGARSVVVEYVVTTVMSTRKNEWIIRYRKDRGKTYHQCSTDEIGETIFLTKEEAEQALEGGGKVY